MSWRPLRIALTLCTALFFRSGWAQGGLVGTQTSVRYTPVAFPQLVQLTRFGSTPIGLSGTSSSGNTLTFVLVSGPSLGSLGALDPTAGTVTYTPVAGFSTSDSFTFLVTDGVLSSEVATVTVFAPQPTLNVSTAGLDLGAQITGSKSPLGIVTLSNPSIAVLNISSIAVVGSDAADFAIESSGTCPISGSLAAGASCTVAVSLTPLVAGARSGALTITDNALDSPQSISLSGTGTDFSFGPATGGSTSATVTAGQPATYNLQLNGVSGFTGPVSLSCTGAPSLATCSVSPPQINATGAATPFAVTVTTTAPHAAQLAPSPSSGAPPYFALWSVLSLLGFMLLYAATSRVRGQGRFVRATAAIGLGLLLISCGGGGGGTPPPPPVTQPGTPAGTYTLTVAGQAKGATRSIPLTLIVH